MPGKTKAKYNGATLDFESQLWAAADKLRGHMDSSEYKHVVLGLIFLKYISDSFEEVHGKLLIRKRGRPGRPGRVPGAERVLGAERSALAVPAGQSQAARDREIPG